MAQSPIGAPLADYSETLAYIHGINRYAKKLGLENIVRLMKLLGDPQKRLRFIHIAGTNGKGSTAALTASVMRAAGYRTGLYTSPYLQRFTERIRVDGAEIPENVLVQLANVVRVAAETLVKSGRQHPTELEVIAAIAFLYFERERCDVVAFEVGLGGRFDPTNVIDTPLAAVIATIDYDHMAKLGDTLEKIAFEKAGIIKTGGDAVLYPQPDSVRRVFEEKAQSVGARLKVCDFTTLRQKSYGAGGQTFSYKSYDDLEISLLGDFQARNAALVVEAVETINQNGAGGIYVSESALRLGLKRARWPGRMEILREDPTFIIDAAHNAQCALALRETLDKYFPRRKKIFIMGVVQDKDYARIIDVVLPIASAFFTVTTESARALPADALADAIREQGKRVLCDWGGARLAGRIQACASPAEAAERALALAKRMERGETEDDAMGDDAAVGDYATTNDYAAKGGTEDGVALRGGASNDAAIGDVMMDGAATGNVFDSASTGNVFGGASTGSIEAGPVICAFGSIYYIGLLRNYFGINE